MLKGADMKVFQAAISSGLSVFVKPLFSERATSSDDFFVGDYFCHYSDDNTEYDTGLKFLKEILPNAPEIDANAVEWFGNPLKMDRHEYLHYGNEASVGYVYSSAAIIVAVPSWKDRRQSARMMSPPPNYDSYISHAEEFEGRWARSLQHFLKKESVIAFVYQNGQDGKHRNNRDAEALIESSDTQPIPKACFSRERSVLEKTALSKATKAIVVVISPAFGGWTPRPSVGGVERDSQNMPNGFFTKISLVESFGVI
ncbi:hypothetical protein BDR26DRAFT_63059 [Obelidium mucronatum]|nr:hypothetical protein BDR26DRAFT_63059 [Obelidium mucronatum]